MLDAALATQVETAIRAGDDVAASVLLTSHYQQNPAFNLKIERLATHFSVVRWEVRPTLALLELNACLIDGRVGEFYSNLMIRRLLAVTDLLAAFHRNGRERGTVLVNLGDQPEATSGLAFCSNDTTHILIPDSDFLGSDGYGSERLKFLRPRRWEDRLPLAFWRGYPGGRNSGNTWRTLERAKLCEVSYGHAVSHLFDVGFSHLPPNSQEANEIREAGFVKHFVPSTDLDKYKYHIDIDGHTNAWSGLFRKLLSGSPVLKIKSTKNFRQWYYHNLKPYVNYVPVESDMRDLVEKLQWLRSHDSEAREIGRLGAELGYAMSYEAEIQHTIWAIENTFQRCRAVGQICLVPSHKGTTGDVHSP
jgi:hypothetical protein